MTNIPEKLQHFECPKCGHRHCQRGEIRTTGSFLTKLLNIQNRRFISYTCAQCGYTEFFATSSSMAGNVLDFFT